MGIDAILRESARSLSTVALTRYAIAVNLKINNESLGYFLLGVELLTVSGMHDIVQVMNGQTTICVRLSCNTAMKIIAVTAWFIYASSRKEVR